MRHERGWTLIEVLITVILLGGIGVTMLATATHVHDEERYTNACATDMSGLRRAVQALERDLRAAADVKELEAHAYSFERGVLRRDGESLARNLALFEVSQEGRIARVKLALGPRSDAPLRREASLDFRVRMRGAGNPR